MARRTTYECDRCGKPCDQGHVFSFLCPWGDPFAPREEDSFRCEDLDLCLPCLGEEFLRAVKSSTAADNRRFCEHIRCARRLQP